MAYKVIKAFTDGQDNRYVYKEGDEYPREGYKPSKDRIKGLLGTDNKQGVPLIEGEKIEEEIKEPVVEEVEETPRKKRRKKG